MLQQTQVATVVAYYRRFLETFPTLVSLASADEQDVLRLWEGLGYYRRARDLHHSARIFVGRYGGVIPNDPNLLKELPGFGRYTIGAVLSQAYDRRLAALEVNSSRVLRRFLGIQDDPGRSTSQRRLWQLAEALLPQHRIGDFNQAMMELGALICTPMSPRCAECPLTRRCKARASNLQETIPAKANPPRIEETRELAVVVRRQGQVFIVQRPSAGRWGNLWEFPHGPLENDFDDCAHRLLRETTGLEAEIGPEIMTIRHGITRFRITMICVEAVFRVGEFRSSYYTQGMWVTPESLSSFPVSSPQRRLADALQKHSPPRLF
jgi:A/G-specific adenine glycosylase